jgi:N-acetyl-gamma-glutamyl-phosphate reductase
MPRIFIDGEAGTTGLGIRERLAPLRERGAIELLSIAHEHRKDPAARRDMMAQADLAVLCLPDDAARTATRIADELGESGPRLLDASTAHRVAEGWTYGFPEMTAGQAQAIRHSRRVSNPGCYPTGAVALLRPLVEAGLLPPDACISINAVSGYTGGGRADIEAHERTGGPAFELYGLALAHKHVPEIQRYAALDRRPLFVPSVGHFPQGMIVSIPVHLAQLSWGATSARLHEALSDAYAGSDVISVCEAEARLDAAALAGSDRMELRVHREESLGHALLTARLDNLGKGASGAALQNIGLMLDLA